MANKILEHRLVDGTNRALIKYVIVPDGSATSNVVLLDASSLRFALNTSGQIMTANTNPRSEYRTSIKRIWGSARASSGHYALCWHGASNNDIVTINTGVFDYNFSGDGTGGMIDNPESGASGDILLTARGPAAGDSLTVFIELKKDNKDFDAGQSADRLAFNR